MTEEPANAQLRSFVERILRCREAEDEAKADTKDVYAEVASAGFDKTVMGKLVAEIRARAKHGDKLDEAEAILDLYRQAYHGASHTYAREAAE